MPTLLIVEDDTELALGLSEFLRSEGFAVVSAHWRAEAQEILARGGIALVLLDISLADGDGFSLCREIKSDSGLPVVFLTASDDELSTVEGLELGADDYIAKPFRPRELVSRIKAVLRRSDHGGGTMVTVGDVLVDTARGCAARGGQELYLSALEYRLLLAFINNRGALLTRERLLTELWDPSGEYITDNTLTVYVKRLREKLGDDLRSPSIIKTVRGVGYRLD